MKNFLSKMPSIFWVFIIPLGLVLFIGGIIFIFYQLASTEGVASILILVIAIGIIRISSDGKYIPKTKEDKSFSSLGVAMGIVFFAIMGMSVDQPGNFIYNKPLEWINCKDNTHLVRDVIVSNPLPERTDIVQGFYCVDSNNEIVNRIDVGQLIVVRFVEYVIIGYGLIYANKLYNTFKLRRTQIKSENTKNEPLIQKF